MPTPLDDKSYPHSLSVRLKLTADDLAQHPGALDLWTAAAIFPTAVSDDLLTRLEEAGGWKTARSALVGHHVLTRRDDRWHILPLVARFALDASARTRSGFDWARCRKGIRAIFEPSIALCGAPASTEDVLAARQWVLNNFESVTRLIRQEISYRHPQIEWIEVCHHYLRNIYQLSPALSRELLLLLLDHLPYPASAVLSLGILELQLDRVDAARGLFERALTLFEKQQDGPGQAHTLRMLGDVESRLERPDAARPLYERALMLYEKERDPTGQANALRELGGVETQNGRLEDARKFYERALTLYYDLKHGAGQASTIQSLGDLRRASGDLSGAVNLYERAAAGYVREQMPMDAANAFCDLARCHHVLGNARQRDLALVNALEAASCANAVKATQYVENALLSIIGSPEAAQEWRERHGVK